MLLIPIVLVLTDIIAFKQLVVHMEPQILMDCKLEILTVSNLIFPLRTNCRNTSLLRF